MGRLARLHDVDPEENFADLEARLTADFAVSAVDVPAEREQAILALAQGEAARIRRRRTWVRAFGRAVAGTAALSSAASLALVLLATKGARERPPARATARADDLNGDGRVDILDAFAIARVIDHGGPAPRSWDRNADGTIDRRDADRVALAAVSLGPGPR